jgi:hypothetical protein
MKNLFNDISQEEKNRVLEMHSVKKTVISEQPKKPSTSKQVDLGHPIDNPLWKELDNWVTGDGPEVMKYIPNKLLVIGYWDGTKLLPDYTITKH